MISFTSAAPPDAAERLTGFVLVSSHLQVLPRRMSDSEGEHETKYNIMAARAGYGRPPRIDAQGRPMFHR